MTQTQKVLRILRATPGVVAHRIFHMHGLEPGPLRTAICRIRKKGHDVESVNTVGYRLRSAT